MPSKKLPAEALEFFRRQGKLGGRIGGRARMENLTAEEKTALAKKAVDAREAKRKAAAKSAEVRSKKAKSKTTGKRASARPTSGV